MPIMVRTALLFVLFWGVMFVADVRAQEPDDEPASLSTDDIYPNGTAPVAAGPEVDAFWNQIYAEMAKNPSMPKADVEAFKARIEGGGSIDFAARLSLDSDGTVRGFSVERNTGLSSIDSAVTDGARFLKQGSLKLGKEFAGISSISFESSLTKAVIQLRGTITTLSPARAAELVRMVEQAREATPDPQVAQLVSALVARQEGNTVTVEATWPVASIMSMAGMRR